MSRFAIQMALIPVTLVLAACAPETREPTSPAVTPAAVAAATAAAASSSDRPIVGRCEAVSQPPVAAGPGMIRQVDVGSCQLSHLGRAAFHSDKLISLASGTQTTQVTLTAANGDVLRGSGSGTNTLIAPGLVGFETDIAFTGGTGRFAGATGTARAEGMADVVGRTSSLTLEGGIAYRASDRR